MDQKPKQIQIQASKDELKGVYSNVMQVSHTKEEFVLDFLNIVGSTGVLSSRVILSPSHFKRMIRVLEENLRKYEEHFGKIPPAETPEREIGFKP
jgi:translation initiation factor 2 beta subunit (eIF-2beta)/eIF-5